MRAGAAPVYLSGSTISAALRFAHQVRHGSFVAAPETFAVRLSLLGRKMRMPVLISIVHVGLTVIPIILARSLDSIVKTPALDFV
jgi:hypothetical protein